MSGGLAPTLVPGDLIFASEVRTLDGERFTPDAALAALLGDAAWKQAAILGVDAVIASAADKERLFVQKGAVAVDMESHAVARAAAAAAVPFAALRAIADPASRALPPAALNAVAPDGSTKVLATLLECAKAPGQFPALLKLGSDSAAAQKSLRSGLGDFFRSLFLGFDF